MSGLIQPFPVEKEYEKNPDISPEDIRKLREWLKTQPHLPEKYISELDLILIYFCCDKSSEVSKQVLDLHFTLRTHLTDLVAYREVDKRTIKVLHTVLLTGLPTPTVNGYKAFYCRLLDGDPKNYMFTDIVRTFLMMFDLLQYEEGTWPGAVLLIDMDMVCLGHVGRIDVTTLKQMLYFQQEGMLVKLKEIHFLNAPSFMERFMMLIRPFTKKTLLDLIRIHERDSDTLDKFVLKDSLPKESGGKYKDNITLRDELIQRLQNNEEYFKKENLRRVNESLRINGKKNPVEDFLGVQGSFKKLDID